MSKWKTWFAVALGVGGLMFLSGAFERFIGWDRENHKTGTGLLTAGLAVAGAYLAHAMGAIDGDTRNTVIAAGVAIGAYEVVGQKVYDFGADVAAKFRGKSSDQASNSRMGVNGNNALASTTQSGALTPPPPPPTGITGYQTGMAPSTTAAPATSAAPVYNVKVEAPKAEKPNVALELGKAGIAALAQFGSAFVSGSKGGDEDLLVLGSLR
jgi:hypothetical protein